MEVQSLIDIIKSFNAHGNLISTIFIVLLFLTLAIFLFIFLRRREWLLNKKYIIGYITASTVLSIIIFFLVANFLEFSFNISNILSVIVLVIIVGIFRYLTWEHHLKIFYKNPKDNLYHVGDWVWILVGVLGVLAIGFYAYFFIIK